MKYFTIDIQVETEQTGKVYPQLEILSGGNHNDPQSVMVLSKYNITETSTVFKLDKGAKLTDFISWGSLHYYVISQRMKDILLEFNLVDTEFIPVKIHLHENDSWYVLNPRHSNQSLASIDFNRSVFGELDPDTRKVVRTFKFPNGTKDIIQQWRDEQKVFHEDYHELVVCEMYLIETENHIDFVPISPILNKSGIVISEELKNKLEEVGITGLDISEFEWGKSSLN